MSASVSSDATPPVFKNLRSESLLTRISLSYQPGPSVRPGSREPELLPPEGLSKTVLSDDGLTAELPEGALVEVPEELPATPGPPFTPVAPLPEEVTVPGV